MNPVALACVAALGLLLFGLGLAVSLARLRSRRLSGAPDDPGDPLARLVRAHGNTAEYAPFLAVLMLYLGTTAAPPWVGWTMIAATVCRWLFVIGMLAWPTMARPNPVRFTGALGTYVAGLMLCLAVVRTL